MFQKIFVICFIFAFPLNLRASCTGVLAEIKLTKPTIFSQDIPVQFAISQRNGRENGDLAYGNTLLGLNGKLYLPEEPSEAEDGRWGYKADQRAFFTLNEPLENGLSILARSPTQLATCITSGCFWFGAAAFSSGNAEIFSLEPSEIVGEGIAASIPMIQTPADRVSIVWDRYGDPKHGAVFLSNKQTGELKMIEVTEPSRKTGDLQFGAPTTVSWASTKPGTLVSPVDRRSVVALTPSGELILLTEGGGRILTEARDIVPIDIAAYWLPKYFSDFSKEDGRLDVRSIENAHESIPPMIRAWAISLASSPEGLRSQILRYDERRGQFLPFEHQLLKNRIPLRITATAYPVSTTTQELACGRIGSCSLPYYRSSYLIAASRVETSRRQGVHRVAYLERVFVTSAELMEGTTGQYRIRLEALRPNGWETVAFE